MLRYSEFLLRWAKKCGDDTADFTSTYYADKNLFGLHILRRKNALGF